VRPGIKKEDTKGEGRDKRRVREKSKNLRRTRGGTEKSKGKDKGRISKTKVLVIKKN